MELINSKIIFKVLFILLLLSRPSWAQEGKEVAAGEEGRPGKEAPEKKEVKRNYTEEEFKKAVNDEIDKKLTRVGRGKIIPLTRELFQKEEAIKVKELEIKKREEELQVNIKEFEKRVKKLLGEQEKIIGCIDENKNREEERLNHMVQVISNMKPANSAAVLSVQESGITVRILGKLDPVKVSKIFNLMDKEVSARLQKQYMTMKR